MLLSHLKLNLTEESISMFPFGLISLFLSPVKKESKILSFPNPLETVRRFVKYKETILNV